MERSIAVTGTTGYVGSRIKDYFIQKGFAVQELNRRSNEAPLRLGLPIVPSVKSVLKEVSAIVHCSWDFSLSKWTDIRRVNVDGSIQLFEAAKEADTPMVFISSISAFQSCRSLYGKAKLAVEEEVLSYGGVVLRPGLVYGSDPVQWGGMMGTLRRVVEKTSVAPVIAGGPRKGGLYLCHENDLCRLVEKSVASYGELSSPMVAAEPSPWTLGRILKKIGEKQGKKLKTVPIPWQAVWMGLKGAECFGVQMGFRSDSLVSLIHPDPQPNFAQKNNVGFEFSAFN